MSVKYIFLRHNFHKQFISYDAENVKQKASTKILATECGHFIAEHAPWKKGSVPGTECCPRNSISPG